MSFFICNFAQNKNTAKQKKKKGLKKKETLKIFATDFKQTYRE